MTDTDGPFDGKPWAEAQWARHAPMWAPSGVYGAPAASPAVGDLPLSVSGLSVGLGAGRAWVRGFGFERTGAAVMQAVAANSHGSFSRRDRIVLRRNLAAHTLTPVLIQGAPSGTPTAPALTQSETGSWDLPLFSFLVPPNSGTTITGVVDERVFLNPDIGGTDTGWVTTPNVAGWTGNTKSRVKGGILYVSVFGTRSGANIAAFQGALIAQLPEEHWPDNNYYVTASSGNAIYGEVYVNTSGQVALNGAIATSQTLPALIVCPVD